MPTARRTPQDRKPKATEGTAGGLFSFTHDGEEYTFPKPFTTVQTPGFLRANRRRDELDMAFTIIEVLADDDPDILAVIDKMPLPEFNNLQARLGKALQDSVDNADVMGESAAS